MAKWFYYNEQGEKIETTGGRLKGLAKQGLITPETIVENEEGKKARAGKVKGLTFATSAPPETIASEAETYGLSQPKPPAEINPFTAVAPVVEPVEVNPFAAAPSVEVNPFTASTPSMVNRTEPQSVSDSFADPQKESSLGTLWKSLDISFSRVYVLEGNNLAVAKIFYYIVALVCILNVIWTFFNFCLNWFDTGDLLTAFQRHSVVLIVALFVSATIIVIVRVSLDMLLRNRNNLIPVFAGIGALLLVCVVIGIASNYSGGGWKREADSRQIMEQRHQSEIRMAETNRESQGRIATTRARSEIDQMRQQHRLRIIDNQLRMTDRELDGLRRMLDLELQQFITRKEMEILTRYGVSVSLR